jgi:hypothetical protein
MISLLLSLLLGRSSIHIPLVNHSVIRIPPAIRHEDTGHVGSKTAWQLRKNGKDLGPDISNKVFEDKMRDNLDF